MSNKPLTSLAIATALSFSAVASAGDPVSRALGHLQNSSVQAGIVASDDQFTARDVIVDKDGSEHVRFNRSYKGLPVIGGDIVVHSTSQGAFSSASTTLTSSALSSFGSLIPFSTNPSITKKTAIALAERSFSGSRTAASKAKLVVYARGSAPVLAWDVVVTGKLSNGMPSVMHYIVDDTSAQVIDRWDDIQTDAANGTGNSFYSSIVPLKTDRLKASGSGYDLRDPKRGQQSTRDSNNTDNVNSGTIFNDADNTWGDSSLMDRATVAVDAQFGAAIAWDYYKTRHGRKGVDGKGKETFSNVHFGTAIDNAFWNDSCDCMSYGWCWRHYFSVGFAGYSRTLTHGVTRYTAGLIFSGESGGLNEATSDIMGAMVEFSANRPSDSGDYLISENVFESNPKGTKALRYMFKPSLDEQSPDCYSSAIGSLDVHRSSGVANHFFYLLAEGAAVPTGFALTQNDLVCNGDIHLTGIGRDNAAKIWYHALTHHMTSNNDYDGACKATDALMVVKFYVQC